MSEEPIRQFPHNPTCFWVNERLLDLSPFPLLVGNARLVCGNTFHQMVFLLVAEECGFHRGSGQHDHDEHGPSKGDGPSNIKLILALAYFGEYGIMLTDYQKQVLPDGQMAINVPNGPR